MPRRLTAWVPVVIWAGVIFALSSIPGRRIPSVAVPNSDKLAHASVYAVLGALAFRAVKRSSSPARGPLFFSACAIAFATVYGMSDELHQFLTPDRTPDWHDVAADAIGGAIGAVVMVAVPWLKIRTSSMMGRSDE